jgi:hypothetical protein
MVSLIGVYNEALSGKGKYPVAAEDELQLVEGLRLSIELNTRQEFEQI